MPTDAELLRRYAAEKSEAAFAEVVARHFDLVYSAALRQVGGDAHRARDVSQVVFTQLARKAAALAAHPVLAGWLYTATRHAAGRALRSEARRAAREQEAHLMQQLLGSDDTASLDWQRVREVLDPAMAELGERDREAVLLRFFARQPFAEIGAALHISEDAARMRVERALDRLHALLARRGVTSTAGALAVALAQQAVVAAPGGMAAGVSTAAVASAGGAVGGLGVLFQFMATSKIVTAAAAALLLLSVGVALRETRADTATAVALVRAADETARDETRLRELQERVAGTRATLAAEPSAASAPAAMPLSPEDAGREFLARHPEARELLTEIGRAETAGVLAAHYRAVSLSPAERERLESIYARTVSATRQLNGPNGRMLLRRDDMISEAEAERLTRASLGDAVYEKVMGEGRALSSGHDLARKFAGAVYRTDPLSEAQIEYLLPLFASSMTAALRARETEGTLQIRQAEDPQPWERILGEAKAVLTPAQFAALETLRPQPPPSPDPTPRPNR